MLKKLLGLAIGVIFVGAVASSQAGDFYGGAAVGHYSVTADDDKFSGPTLTVFGGYDYNPYLSFELEHMMHGTDTNRSVQKYEWGDYDWDEITKIKGKGTDTIFWVVPTWPINDAWSLYGALGWGYYDYDLKGSIKYPDGELVEDYDGKPMKGAESFTGTSFYSGAGIKWESENWGARLEFLNQENFGTEVMSLGFMYNF